MKATTKLVNVEEVLKQYCADQEGTVKHGGDARLYFGKAHHGELVGQRLPEGFVEIPEWRDGGYRITWTSIYHRCTVTYCEGDIHVVKCETLDAFIADITEASAFYKRCA